MHREPGSSRNAQGGRGYGARRRWQANQAQCLHCDAPGPESLPRGSYLPAWAFLVQGAALTDYARQCIALGRSLEGVMANEMFSMSWPTTESSLGLV